MGKFYDFEIKPNKMCQAFGDNVPEFVSQCGELEKYEIGGKKIWKVLFVKKSESTAVPLYVLEEEAKNSANPYCRFCRNTGWSDHFLTKKSYHFLIARECFWKNQLDPNMNFEDSLLYSIIHCNGIGHLVSINGFEGGSEYLSGTDIMNFFDTLCGNLSARSVDVIDVSVKWSSPSRLVYGIAYGKSWFTSWGYKFVSGCYGLKEADFENAVNVASSVRVDELCASQQHNCEVVDLILWYTSHSSSTITTLRDLFKVIIGSLTEEGALLQVGAKTKEALESELNSICNYLLMGPIGDSIRVFYDNNRSVKQWTVEDVDMSLRYVGYVDGLPLRSSPGDLIVVPLATCYDGLKIATQEALRSNYCMLESYNVESIANEAGFDLLPDDWIACVKHGSKLLVKGNGLDFDTPLKYQGGPTLSNVRCPCGATTNDSKRMGTCFACNFTQHLKCNNIPDDSDMPPLFLCRACCQYAITF